MFLTCDFDVSCYLYNDVTYVLDISPIIINRYFLRRIIIINQLHRTLYRYNSIIINNVSIYLLLFLNIYDMCTYVYYACIWTIPIHPAKSIVCIQNRRGITNISGYAVLSDNLSCRKAYGVDCMAVHPFISFKIFCRTDYKRKWGANKIRYVYYVCICIEHSV